MAFQSALLHSEPPSSWSACAHDGIFPSRPARAEACASEAATLAHPQDAWDAASARSVCRSWRAAGEQLRHPRLTVFTDSDEQTLRAAKGLRTGLQVRWACCISSDEC